MFLLLEYDCINFGRDARMDIDVSRLLTCNGVISWKEAITLCDDGVREAPV